MYVRKNGLHEGTIVIDGKQKHFYGKTDAEVKKKMLLYQSSLKEKKDKGATFESIAESWWNDHTAEIRPGTVTCYQAAYDRTVQHFEGEHVKQISPMACQSWIKDVERLGYSKQTVRIHLAVLSMILDYAVLLGEIETNPAKVVKISKGLSADKRHGASPEQISLIDSSVNLPFGLFAYLLVYTGLRRGEALALTRKDIDLEQNIITVNKKLRWEANRPVIDRFLKTEAGYRTVVLPEKLKTVLVKNIAGVIFAGANGYLTETEYRHRWAAYCKASGLENITPHNLRHTYATILYDANVDAKSASRQLGHSKEAVTRDIYTKISQSRMQDTVNKLNEYLTVRDLYDTTCG